MSGDGGRLVIRGALLPGEGSVDIAVEAGRIAAVMPEGGLEAGGKVIDGRGRLAVPGYVNGHVHSHELLFRGRSEKLRLEEWMTSVRPTPPLPLTARDVYLRTLAVAAEALRSGTTTICDDVGIDCVRFPEHLDAVAAAYRDAGIRAFVGPTLFDVPFAKAVPFAEEEFSAAQLAAVARAAAHAPDPARMLDAFRRFAAGLAQEGGLVRAIATPSAPQRCSPELLAAVRETADALALPVMIHVHETRTQAVGARQTFGRGMIAHLDALGFLKARTSIIHGVWLDDDDLARIARAGATVQHNPASNLKLGSGVAPVRAMLAQGVNVSLASDGCGSIDTVSMQPNVMLAALLSTLRGEPEDWLSATEALHAATRGGAAALGLEDEIGRIAPGYRADIVLYDMTRPPFVPLNDAVRQLVYAGPAANVATVLVDGRIVFEDGRLTLVDEDALHGDLTALHGRMLPAIEVAERSAMEIMPAMRRICRRCAALPLPPGVHPARLAGGRFSAMPVKGTRS